MKKSILFLLIIFGILINCESQILSENQRVIHDIDSIRKVFHIPGLTFGVANCASTIIVGGLGIRVDLPVKLTSSRRFILTSVRRSILTTYFQP